MCFDGDIDNEIYKTEATVGGKTATWNHTFQLDLSTNVKAIVAANRPEPTYLTFFLFDTGTPGVPSLGSAGVLLSTVHDRGRAQGDFPIVNGTGTLRLVVTSEKTKPGRLGFGGGTGDPEEDDEKFENAAKIAGITAGVAALGAAGIGYAVHHKKKKDKDNEGDDGGEKKKKKKWFSALRSGSSSSSEEDEDRPDDEGREQTEDRELRQEGRELPIPVDGGGTRWTDDRRDDYRPEDDARDDRDGTPYDHADRNHDSDDANDQPDDDFPLPHDVREENEHESVAIPYLEDSTEVPPVAFNLEHETYDTHSDERGYPAFDSGEDARADGWVPSDDANYGDFADEPADFGHGEEFE